MAPTSPLTAPERSSFLRCSMDVCELEVHKRCAGQQNKAYKRDTDAAVAGEDGVAVVVLDYKANVRTGVKRRETDQAPPVCVRLLFCFRGTFFRFCSFRCIQAGEGGVTPQFRKGN